MQTEEGATEAGNYGRWTSWMSSFAKIEVGDKRPVFELNEFRVSTAPN